VPSEDAGIEFLEIKPGDVPIYVESGAADLGITGTDVLREANPDVLEPLELDFGQCRLVVAAPAGAAYPALPGGITPRLATIAANEGGPTRRTTASVHATAATSPFRLGYRERRRFPDT